MIVLVLSPHTDDGELAAGGTIARLAREGNEIIYVAFSYCEDTIPDNLPASILKDECKKALAVLGVSKTIFLNFKVREFLAVRQKILDTMVRLKKDIGPSLVLSPSSFDTHQDHQVIYNECVRAFKKSASIWGMEHPLNNLSFRTDIFVTLTREDLNKKITALKFYKSQESRPYFEEGYIKSVVRMHGMNVNTEFAEVFECIRLVK